MADRKLLRVAMQCAEVAVHLCGLAGAAVIARQIAVLLEFVTFGPLLLAFTGGSQGLAVYRGLEAVGLEGWRLNGMVWPAGILVLCSAAILAKRVRRVRGPEAGARVLQVAGFLAMLGWSYRFVGLCAGIGVIIWQWRSTSVGWRGREWAAWAVVVAVCVLPVDVTCRNLAGPSRFEPTTPCATAVASREYAAKQRVCGTDGLYNEPTRVWVW